MWKWGLKKLYEIAHVLPRFRHERDEYRNREHVISSRSSLIWGEHEQLHMMFKKTILHHVFFSCTIFFYESRKILNHFFYPIAFCTVMNTKTKTKNSKVKREGRSIWNLLLHNKLFFSFTIFSLRTFSKIT